MNRRNLFIVASVVLLHALALWAFHTGLMRRITETVVPVMLISSSPPPPLVKPPPPIEPPVVTPPPKPEKEPPPPIATPKPVLTPPPATPPAATPPPEVLSVPNPPVTTTPVAPTPAPPPATTAPATVSVAPAPTVAAAPPTPKPASEPPPAPVPAKVELPSSKADYLHNPPPDYPRMSVRLGEQGQVVVKVLIGADGVPQKAELHTSSGFERLDKSALDAAMRWRYVPGKRGGVAEAMWFQVPITFQLKKE